MFKPFDWSGTATRKQFWCVVAVWAAGYVLVNQDSNHPLFGVMIALLLAVQIVLISAVIRRLHDMGYSGFWALATIVPYLGLLALVWIGISKPKGALGRAWPALRRHKLPQIAMALLVPMALLRVVWAPYWIPSESMKPTLLVGDYIAVKLSHDSPRRGDVFVFRHPVTNAAFVARIMGIAGDTVQMVDGQVILNGDPLQQDELENFVEKFSSQGPLGLVPRCVHDPVPPEGECIKQQFVESLPTGESYRILNIGNTRSDNSGIFTVPNDMLFVLADNRDNATDSRVAPTQRGMGFVPVGHVIGQPSRVIFSAEGSSLWAFWTWRRNRFFTPID